MAAAASAPIKTSPSSSVADSAEPAEIDGPDPDLLVLSNLLDINMELDLDTCFPKTEVTFQKIDSSLTMLQQVFSSQVSLSNIFRRPLYTGTAFDRTGILCGNPQTQKDSDDSILRKNLYFLATNMQNPINLIIDLVQQGVLTLEEKDAIMRNETEHMKIIVTLMYLVKKSANLFPEFKDALTATQNDKVADILQTAINTSSSLPTKPKRSYKRANAGGSGQVGQDGIYDQNPTTSKAVVKKEIIEWQCPTCTFVNNSTNQICEMCCKTKDFKDDPSNSALQCPKCTFINQVGNQDCVMCDFQIVPTPKAARVVAAEYNTSSDDD